MSYRRSHKTRDAEEGRPSPVPYSESGPFRRSQAAARFVAEGARDSASVKARRAPRGSPALTLASVARAGPASAPSGRRPAQRAFSWKGPSRAKDGLDRAGANSPDYTRVF